MKVRDAIAQLGVDVDRLPGDLCIVSITKGRARHFTLDAVGDREITRDLYLASGTFAPGSIREYEGRTAENLTSVLWLVGDFDLKDSLGLPLAALREWSDGDLLTAARGLAQDVRGVYEHLGVPVHRQDFTGYGIATYTYLNGHDAADIAEIRELNRTLVETINTQWGSILADPGVHDAGTRIMRLVPGPNTKGSIPRQTQTIHRTDGHVTVAELSRTLQKRTRTTVARAIPKQGSDIPSATIHLLIEAITPHWVEGKRHGLALAVAGILAKAGVAETQAMTIIEHVALASGDSELADRIKAVETSYIRARNGLETRGLFGLRDWLPIETVEWIDRTLDEVRPRAAEVTFTVASPNTTTTLKGSSGKPIPFAVAPIPEIARRGLVSKYIDLVGPSTEASDGFHLGTVLTIAAAMIGRRVSVNYGRPTFANLFTLLVGPTGKGRKDTAIKGGTRFLSSTVMSGTTQLRANVQVLTDVGSSEALIKALSKQPSILLYVTEFSKLIAKARRPGTATIIPVLMEAFDTPPKLSNISLANPIEAEFPYLSIISATQPRVLEGLLTDEDVHSGAINRWLIFAGVAENPNPWPPSIDQQVSELLFEEMHTAIHGGYTDGQTLSLSVDAVEFWDSWYRAHWNRECSEDEAAMRVRHPDLVVKLSLIYSVLNGDQVITLESLHTGIAIIDWMWEHVARLVPSWGGTIHGKIEAKVTQFLTDRGGSTARRDISRYCKSRIWGTTDLNVVLDAMHKAGLVVIDAHGTVSLRHD